MNEQLQKPCRCDVYSRVVGYFRPVSHWNKGKKEEFSERKTFLVRDLAHGSQKVGLQHYVDEQTSDVLLFTTEACPNCKQIMPVLDDQFTVEKVDAFEQKDKVDKFKITLVPTAVFLDKQGNAVHTAVGPDEIRSYVGGL